jgi:hypothetical protein
MNEITIDVITPVLNGEDLLERCVLSVQQSHYPALIHTLVVDERCKDHSKEIGRRLAETFSNVRFILDDGKSAMAAINHGLDATAGDVVTWLGHDNTWTEYTPWVVNDCFGSNPKTDFLSGAVVIVSENGLTERTRLPLPDLDLIDLYFSQYIPAQEGCFWRRGINRALGENYITAFDYELWLRLLSQDVHVECTNQTLAVFQKRAGQLSSSRTRYAEEMNRGRMELAAQRLGGKSEAFAGRWQQLEFLMKDPLCVELLKKKKVALSPRFDCMPSATGDFYFYVQGPGEIEIVSSQVEARLITICDRNGPIRSQKVRGTEGRFRFKSENSGFYFVDLTARGTDDSTACRLRCDEVLWNGKLILCRNPHRSVAADCPRYQL